MIDNLTDAIKTYENYVMSAEATSKALRKEGVEKDAKYYEDTANFDKQIIAWLTELTDRREADRWIPVSEKSPEDYTKVLITNEYGIVTFVTWNTWYQNEYKDARKEYKAIAWRPSPESYKENELKPTKDLINDIVGFDVSGIKPLPEYKESEPKECEGCKTPLCDGCKNERLRP